MEQTLCAEENDKMQKNLMRAETQLVTIQHETRLAFHESNHNIHVFQPKNCIDFSIA